MKSLILAVALGTLTFVPPAIATTYDVDWTFGQQQVTGTIETDGRTGTLAFTSTIENWASVDITLTSPGLFGGGPALINDTNLSQFSFMNLILTPTELIFDFDGFTNFVASNRVSRDIDAPLGQSFFCLGGATFSNACLGSTGAGQSMFGEFSGVGNVITNLNIPFSSTQVIATATPVTTPVPLPAGAYFLISGLAGLIALRHKRTI